MIRLGTFYDYDEIVKQRRELKGSNILRDLRDSKVYIFEIKEKIVGWLRFSNFWDDKVIIGLFYIVEQYRGQGVGSIFLSDFEKEMKSLGIKSVFVTTSSEETAKEFYIKRGYEKIGGFTLKNEPYEIIFSKDLR